MTTSIGQSRRDEAVYQHIWSTEPDRPPGDTYQGMIDLAVAEAGDPAKVKVADLASGSGRHARWAARKGCAVEAIEYDGTAVERQLAEDGRTWPVTRADVREWLPQQADGAYDAVVCFDALHHMVTDVSALEPLVAHVRRIVRPGGLLLLTLLCDISYSAGIVPADRLLISNLDGEAFFRAAFLGDELLAVKHKAVDVASTRTADADGNVVETAYHSERVLVLVRRGA